MALLRNVQHPLPALFTGLCGLLLCCVLWLFIGQHEPEFFSRIDNSITDIFFEYRGPIDTSGSVVIVDIDEKSLQTIGQWPWPRDVLANLVNNILATDPVVLGFGLIFAEHDRSSPGVFLEKYHDQLVQLGLNSTIDQTRATLFPDHDILLGNAIAKGRTVLGFNFVFREDFQRNTTPSIPRKEIFVKTHFLNPPENLDKIEMFPLAAENRPQPDFFNAYRAILNIPEIDTATTTGFLNIIPDSDGVVRRAPAFILLDGESYPSLPLEMFRLSGRTSTVFVETDTHSADISGNYPITDILINNYRLSTDRWGRFGINHYGPYNTFLYIPAKDVLNGNSLLPHKAHIILGSSVPGIGNSVKTPFSSHLPEAELQATLLDNLLQHNTLEINSELEFNFTIILLIIGTCIVTMSVVYLVPLLALSISGLGLASALGVAYFLFVREQTPFVFSYVLICNFVIFIAVMLVSYVDEGRRRLFIRKAFSQYVSPSIVQKLLKNPKALDLHHVDYREVTILFCDIRNFSQIAESIPPEELSRMLNNYFSLLTEIILKHKGTIDKYIGDSIMAVWGSPLHDENHALNAVEAGVEMLTALGKANPDLFDREITIGIGINSGMVSAGNFGSEKRFDYTVFGDNVNVASRVEQETKRFKEKLLLTHKTKELLPENYPCVHVATVTVRGRISEVELYTPVVLVNFNPGE